MFRLAFLTPTSLPLPHWSPPPLYRRPLCSRTPPTAVLSRDIVVIGAGIIGLTTAIRLREAGHNVAILTDESPDTIINRPQSPNAALPKALYTSSGSGGLWMPVLLTDPRADHWATSTYHTLVSHIPLDVGVNMHNNLRVYREQHELPWYARLTGMTHATHETDERVPVQYAHAHVFNSPVATAPRYLSYLQNTAEQLSIPIHLTRLYTPLGRSTRWTMDQAVAFASDIYTPDCIIVNCAGIRAEDFTADAQLKPLRGVLVNIKRPEHVTYSVSEYEGSSLFADGLMAYAIPREDMLVLGGTCLSSWDIDVKQKDVDGVLKRALSLLSIAEDEVQVLSHWCGLRPSRSGGVRLEVLNEQKYPATVIANYGHGGSGFTICWGCADEVVNLVNAL